MDVLLVCSRCWRSANCRKPPLGKIELSVLQMMDNGWGEGLMSIRAHSAFYDILKPVFVAVRVHIRGCGVSFVLRNGCSDPRETSSLATQTGLTPTGPTIGAFFPSPFRLIIASVIRVQPVGAYLRGGKKKGKD